MTKIVVFLGPSLRRAEAETLLSADYHPPAGQGDLYRACEMRPAAIALIDGVFKDAPTVRHREILWAMSQGIAVYGASSMGALRAAELNTAGMIGMGLIYRWYRRFPLLPDDAVAVTHTPRELGAHPLSEALVDLRRTYKAAVRAGHLSAAEAQARTAAAERLPFPERHLPQDLQQVRVSQKANDARDLLRHLARVQSTGHFPRPNCPEPPLVHAWLDDLSDSGLTPPNPGAHSQNSK